MFLLSFVHAFSKKFKDRHTPINLFSKYTSVLCVVTTVEKDTVIGHRVQINITLCVSRFWCQLKFIFPVLDKKKYPVLFIHTYNFFHPDSMI